MTFRIETADLDDMDDALVTCPTCKLTASLDDFDTCGACIDQVICPTCCTEFCPSTGEIHQLCPQCRDFDLGETFEQPELF